MWQELGDNSGIALALGQIARCHLAQSDLLEASLIYQQALELWRDQKNLPKQTETLNMLGFTESRKGDWDSAIDYYMQAQSLMNDESAPALRGQLAGGLAYIFNENGLPEEALIQYQRALEFSKQTEGERDDDRMIMLLGYTYFLLGEPAGR